MHSGPASDLAQVKEELEKDFEKVALWAACNLLKLNAEKTVFTLFRSRHVRGPVIRLNLMGQSICISKTMKILGVIFDETMTFSDHANYISRKVTGFLQMLAARRNKLPRSVLIQLINAYVSSQLTYCLAALSASPVICSRFQLLQNYAVRVIFGLRKFSHVTPLRKYLHWQTIRQLGSIKLGISAHKAVHGKGPTYLSMNLSDFSPSHTCHTRSTNFRLPPLRNKYSEK
jgi:hypothetical protein